MSEEAWTPVTKHDDGKFVRTALVVRHSEKGGSIAIVNEEGERIALINMFTNEDNSWFAVDVLDKDGRYDQHSAITFEHGTQRRLDNAKGLVAADFRTEKGGEY